MMEKWKDIKGFEGHYQVSSFGNVYSLKSNKRLSTRLKDNGYVIVTLSKNNKAYTKHVHRLVMESFCFNPFNKRTVNHRNGIKHDNFIENLEWNTYSENNKHKCELHKQYGEGNSMNKLSWKEVCEIRDSNLSHNKLAKLYGVCQSNISAIKNYKTWNHPRMIGLKEQVEK